MEFLPVATPQTESELAVMVSLLDAHGIQHYVHNQGFGGLYPGMQMDLYNARRLMVPADHAAEALDLLAVFRDLRFWVVFSVEEKQKQETGRRRHLIGRRERAGRPAKLTVNRGLDVFDNFRLRYQAALQRVSSAGHAYRSSKGSDGCLDEEVRGNPKPGRIANVYCRGFGTRTEAIDRAPQPSGSQAASQ